MPDPPRLTRRRLLLALLLSGAAGFAALNALAYAHAGSLTSYAPPGSATPPLESLGWGGRLRVLLRGPQLPRPRNERTPEDLQLPYEVRRLKIDSPGVELESWLVRADESRGVVVLLHGFAGSKAALLPHARELHQLGWSCLLVDLRGSGGSSGSSTSLGWHEAEDARAAHDDAQTLRLGPVVVYGQSMGAAAALRAVHLGWIRPSALVLEAPFARLGDAVCARFELLDVPSFPAAELLLFWGGVRGGLDPQAHAPLDYARSVRCPSLVLAGARDRRASLAQAREVASALGQAGRLETFPEATHVATLASDPSRWRRAVTRLLQRVAR